MQCPDAQSHGTRNQQVQCADVLERASIRTGVLPDRSSSFVLLTIYIWRRASGLPPRLGLKRVGTSRLHAGVHILKDYEGFPGKCAEDRSSVFSRNELGRRPHRYHGDIFSRRQY